MSRDVLRGDVRRGGEEALAERLGGLTPGAAVLYSGDGGGVWESGALSDSITELSRGLTVRLEADSPMAHVEGGHAAYPPRWSWRRGEHEGELRGSLAQVVARLMRGAA